MASSGLLVQPEKAHILEPEYLYRQLMQVYGLLVGSGDWGVPVAHTSFDDDTQYAHTLQNQGTGGHLNVPGIFHVDDSGITASAAFLTTLNVSGTANLNGITNIGDASGDTVTVNGTPTFLAASTFRHNVTIQNSALTTLAAFVVTAGAQTATLGAAATPGLYVDVANSRTLVGTTTALTSASNDKFTVVGGTSYFAGNSGPSIGMRFSASDTVGWTLGVEATGSAQRLLARPTTANTASVVGTTPSGSATTAGWHVFNHATPASASVDGAFIATSADLQIRADSPTAAYKPITLYANNTAHATLATTGVLSATAMVAGSATGTLSGTEELRVIGQTRLEGLVEVIGEDIRLEQTRALRATDGSAWRNLAQIDSGDILQYGESGATGAVVNADYVQLKSAGTVRFSVDTTGVGFFATAPVAKQTIVGAKGGNVALANLLTGLANYGLLIDLTT